MLSSGPVWQQAQDATIPEAKDNSTAGSLSPPLA